MFPKKNIAHFVESFPVTGQDYIYNQILNNADTGAIFITERLIQNRNTFNLAPFYYKRYSRCSFLNRLSSKLNDGLFNRIHLQKFNSYAQKILEENKVSLMHAHFGSMGYKLIGLRKKLDIPLVVTFYGVDVSYCLKSRLWLTRFRPMFESADRLIVLCEEAKDRLIGLGCEPEKICIWNIGMDLEGFPYRERQCRGQGPGFLTAARFVEKKGYPILLKAFSILAEKRKDIHLTALGYGPLKGRIQKMIADSGLGSMVTLIDTEKIEDFNQFYRQLLPQHDIFVLPSVIARDGDDEGGPALSLVYAQAAGLPVVATPFAGASRSIIDNKTGLFVESGNTRDLADKMQYLIDNPDIWNNLGRAGSDLVKNEFSLHKQLKVLEDIYASLV